MHLVGNVQSCLSECQDLVVEVDNAIGAKKGDYVEVSMESVRVLKATVLAYLVPLICLLLGTILTYYILNLVKIRRTYGYNKWDSWFGLYFISYLILK